MKCSLRLINRERLREICYRKKFTIYSGNLSHLVVTILSWTLNKYHISYLYSVWIQLVLPPPPFFSKLSLSQLQEWFSITNHYPIKMDLYFIVTFSQDLPLSNGPLGFWSKRSEVLDVVVDIGVKSQSNDWSFSSNIPDVQQVHEFVQVSWGGNEAIVSVRFSKVRSVHISEVSCVKAVFFWCLILAIKCLTLRQKSALLLAGSWRSLRFLGSCGGLGPLGCLLPDLAGTESKEIIKYSRANLFDILVSFCEVYNDLRVFWNTRFRIETSSMLIFVYLCCDRLVLSLHSSIMPAIARTWSLMVQYFLNITMTVDILI